MHSVTAAKHLGQLEAKLKLLKNREITIKNKQKDCGCRCMNHSAGLVGVTL